MKNVLLIGLGRFGRHIAIKLNELHHQVMAVDKLERRVDAVTSYVTNAQIGDSTNEEFMRSLGIDNFDLCIVAIGDDFQSSLETTSLLKELGAKMVVERAFRHARRLEYGIYACGVEAGNSDYFNTYSNDFFSCAFFHI